MSERIGWWDLLKRLRWDLLDRHERAYYGYWFIWQVPGIFGNQLRSKYLSTRMKRAGKNFHVMAGCRFRSMENLEVGDNVNIGFDNFLQAKGGLRIGNNVSLAPGVKIWSTNHDYDDPDRPVSDQGHTNKPVVIGDNVFIASNAFILPGTHLPEGCIVSAGSVVGGKPYRPFSVLAGNPARVIGYRGGRVPTAVTLSAETVESPL
jgi:acetyltransferase-like isoleucine patch superfamily enzyme